MLKINSELEANIIREYCKRSFYNFFVLAWDSVESVEFVDNWHIKFLCDILQERHSTWVKQARSNIDQSELYDILINICPSASKSLIVSVMFPAWIMLNNPTAKILNVTYSYNISEKLASKRLKLMESDLYRKIIRFYLKNKSLSLIQNDRGGSVFSTSTTGSITGMHFDILIVDDPNNPSSIYSEASRNEANRFVNEILPSRKTNIKRSYTIYLQQRFHTDDVSGTLLQQKFLNLKHIIIPAIDENGKSFFETRFPIEYFDNVKNLLGSVQFNAQYMQITQPINGGIIKNDWIKFIDSDSSQKLDYFLDTAYGGQNADDNAIVGVYKKDNNLVIQMAEANKLEFPELIKWLKDHIPAHSRIYIEGKASGKSIIQTLKKETNFNIVEIQPKGSKIERKNGSAPFFESGRIFINNMINHKQKLIEQLIFDNIKNDDLMDVTLYAIDNTLKGNSGKINMSFVK